MSTYSNVYMACVKREIMVWGWVGKCDMVRSAEKSQGNIRELYTALKVVTLLTKDMQRRKII